jgi:hypothetical protein
MTGSEGPKKLFDMLLRHSEPAQHFDVCRRRQAEGEATGQCRSTTTFRDGNSCLTPLSSFIGIFDEKFDARSFLRGSTVIERAVPLAKWLAARSHLLFGPRQTRKTFLVRRALPAVRIYGLLDSNVCPIR